MAYAYVMSSRKKAKKNHSNWCCSRFSTKFNFALANPVAILILLLFADPERWNRDQVRAWLQFTVKQFKLPSMPDIERVFTEDGVQLSQLNEIDFINRLPQVCVSFADSRWCLRTECKKFTFFFIQF